VKIGILERNQLWVSDEELWRKLSSSTDTELQSQMSAVSEAAASNVSLLEEGAPLATNNGLVLLSDLDPLWAQKLRAYRESRVRGAPEKASSKAI
jgi:hypothetical protein